MTELAPDFTIKDKSTGEEPEIKESIDVGVRMIIDAIADPDLRRQTLIYEGSENA
jgi:hypothetical protein